MQIGCYSYVLANCPVWSCVGGEMVSWLCDPNGEKSSWGLTKWLKLYRPPNPPETSLLS